METITVGKSRNGKQHDGNMRNESARMQVTTTTITNKIIRILIT